MRIEGKKLVHRFVDSGFLWPLVALAFLLCYNLLFTPNFFHLEIKEGHLFGSLVDIFNRGAPSILMAIGMTLVIATGGIDISVGSILAISGAIASVLIASFHAPLWIVVGVPLLVALLLGAWNGMLVAVVGTQPIISTLILMVAGRGIAQLITDGQIVVFEYKPFEFIGGGFFLGLPFSISLIILVGLSVFLITKRTSLGLFIEAVGCNPTASRYAGVNDRMIKMIVYIISGLCAGIAGLIICADIKAADANNAGLFSEMDAILSVAIGGTSMNGGKFSVAGSIIGGLVIQSLTTTIITKGIPVEYTLVVKSLVIVTVFLLQSEEFRRMFTAKKRNLTRSTVIRGEHI